MKTSLFLALVGAAFLTVAAGVVYVSRVHGHGLARPDRIVAVGGLVLGLVALLGSLLRYRAARARNG